MRFISPLSGVALGAILLQLALAHAGEVRDHRGTDDKRAVAPRCDTRNYTHTSGGGCRTAASESVVRDHRSR